MDFIQLEGMVFFAKHGVLPEERTLGQRFTVNVEMSVDLAVAGQSDHVEDTVNYAVVYEQIRKIMIGPACNLLETLAERIATDILAEFAKVSHVAVEIEKPEAPIPGIFNVVRVHIERHREML